MYANHRDKQVVELEISLDETREQYNNVLRTSNNRAQQKKMMFLERNLEQLTVVQRQLVEQNSSLKKEVAIAERKLIARNERIQSLESLLQDSQEKLTAANHRYVGDLRSLLPLLSPRNSLASPSLPFRQSTSHYSKPISNKEGRDVSSQSQLSQSFSPESEYVIVNNGGSFEAQLTAVKERLEAAKQGSTRGLGSPTSNASFAFGGAVGSRIAKPLRGGAAPVHDGPILPALSNIQAQEAGNQSSGKRTSWFFNQR
jgi:kinesin family protein 5